ncbi:MAG: glycosyltransferase involved in cell wall biosynthesis [Acidimicrobiales bacterium]
MKLIIQIPCLNEEDQLPTTLADLPRSVPGFDVVEWLVIDDGSSDRTVEVALANGVDHVISLPQNRGLASAFQIGLDGALKLGADVIVNTDADNQYRADAIPALVAPILEHRADLVVGDREVRNLTDFSRTKRWLQATGSRVVRIVSDTDVPDTTSGFRAYSRDAALGLTVINSYTYTIESIIQAGRSNLAIAAVPVGSNPSTRPSRLFGSTWLYIRRNAVTIIRVFAAYEPLKFFGTMALLLFGASIVSFVPFLLDWIINGDRSGHLQSIILGAILALGALQVMVLAVVADLIHANRRETQRSMHRIRAIEIALGVQPEHYQSGAVQSPDGSNR